MPLHAAFDYFATLFLSCWRFYDAFHGCRLLHNVYYAICCHDILRCWRHDITRDSGDAAAYAMPPYAAYYYADAADGAVAAIRDAAAER